jgi:hypothetical protein
VRPVWGGLGLTDHILACLSTSLALRTLIGGHSMLLSMHTCQINLHEQPSVAFMLTFHKAFDNFYANVGHLKVARNR